MLQRSSSLAHAKDTRRLRLASEWVVVGIVVLVAVLLIWLFPQGASARRVALERRDDPIATDYLRSVLKQAPGDHEVRLELARRHQRLGDYEAALGLLAELRKADAQTASAALQIEIETLEAGSQTGPEAVQNERKQRLLAALLRAEQGVLQQTWRLDPHWLAQKEALYLPARVRPLYLLLAAKEPARKVHWCELAGDSALAQGAYRDAAQDYLCAMNASRDPAHARRFFLQTVRVLQAGNLLPEALRIAEQYGAPFMGERDTLIYLIRLARAANRNDLADRYARQLMRMSSLAGLHVASHTRQVWPDFRPARPMRIADQEPGLAFDEEAYTLAYEVFISNQKLADALRVAQAAVRQRPQNPAWLKRLAQVAEWAGKPELALPVWRALATRFNDEEGWQGMARLAPSLLDEEVLQQLWQREAGRRELKPHEWQQVSDLHERLAQPEVAAELLEQAFARKPEIYLLEMAATLRQRAGQDEQALADYQRLTRQYGPRPTWALSMATLHYIQSRLSAAYAVLAAAADHARAEDLAFWRIYGDLAWQEGRQQNALVAYRQRKNQTDWQSADASRLLDLLGPGQTQERIWVAEAAWLRFRELHFLSLALSLHLDQNALRSAKSLLGTMSAAEAASPDLDFLLQRARYYQLSRQLAAAQRDYLRAEAISPQDEIRASLLWLIIAEGQHRKLQEILPRWEAGVGADSPLNEALAAGWLTLGQAQRALQWMKRALPRHETDYLWLIDYADVLEQTGQVDMAWRIRRHAWLKLRAAGTADPASLLKTLRLELGHAPLPAAEKKLYRALLAAGQGDLAQELEELVYLWALSKEDENQARYWRWRRQAMRLAHTTDTLPILQLARQIKPAPESTQAWHDTDAGLVLQMALELNEPRQPAGPESGADLQAALRFGETEKLQSRLARPRALAPSDQAAIANTLGANLDAQSASWQALDGAPDNDQLHRQAQEQLLARDPNKIAWHADFSNGELRGWEHSLALTQALSPDLRLEAGLARATRHWDAARLEQITRHERLTLRELGQAQDRREITLSQHHGWRDFVGVQLSQQTGRARWQGKLAIDWDQAASDSGFLSLAGKQRQIALNGSYHLARDWTAQLMLSQAQLLDQANVRLGERRQADWTLQWQFASAGQWRLLGQHVHYQHAAPQSTFLPPSPAGQIRPLPDTFSRASSTWSWAQDIAYAKRWYPIGEASLGRHSQNGLETAWQLGARGRAWGADQLRIQGGTTRSLSGRSNKQFSLLYEAWF